MLAGRGGCRGSLWTFIGAWTWILVTAGVAGCGGGGGGGGMPGDPIVVSVTPKRAGLAAGQTLVVSATVANDGAASGVHWIATGGSFAVSTTASGASVAYTAPATGGPVVITATSVADPSRSAALTVGVTDLPGVATYHNDGARTGVNDREFALTPALVSTSTFGRLFSCAADGAIYAQPLWVPNVRVNGATRNVVVVATQHDSVFAFDADTNADPCVPLWKANLLDAAHGGTPTEAPVLSASGLVGFGYGDIAPEIGVTSTPVIDLAAKTVYVVSKSVDSANRFFQRLHALDLATGGEKLNGNQPMLIAATVPGTGDASTNGVVTFDPQTQGQRAGLALFNGVVHVAFTSHEDREPYHGWIIGFDQTTLARKTVFNVSPNGGDGSIWMSGGAPAHDGSSLYAVTSNGTYDGVTEFGDSILRLSPADGLAVQDWFTPSDQANLTALDLDLGSGGAVLFDVPTGPVRRLLVAGGKAGPDGLGQMYVVNRDAMGKYTPTDSGAVQTFALNALVFATPAFWNNTLYLAGVGAPLVGMRFDTTTGQFATTSPAQSAVSFGFPGTTPSISAQGTTGGIVWALDNSAYCTPGQST